MTVADEWRALASGTAAPDARAAQRGLGLFRRGAVRDLVVAPGVIRARVADTPVARAVELHWSPLSAEDAQRALHVLSTQVRFSAALLERRLPPQLRAALDAAGIALVPQGAQLAGRCDCGRWCRHVAAVHLAVAAEFDRDPRAVLRFRGIDDVAALAHAGRRADTPVATFDATADPTRARGDLASIPLHPAPPISPAALLSHLGPPPGVASIAGLAEVVGAAASAAWRLAAGDGADAADEELLLAELRGQRVATVSSLAEALGADPAAIRAALDRLYDAGDVLRTGIDHTARYRAAGR